MNKVYRVVWNEHTNTWVAVQETAKAHGKSASTGVNGSGAGILSRVGIRMPRVAASAMLLALTATAGYAHAGPGIYINDGQDANCTVLPDGSTAVPYAIQPANPKQVSTPLEGIGNVSMYNAADVGLTSSYNPCNSRTTTGSEKHDTQTNRTLFYGDKKLAPTSETDNGAKHLTLGGRLDVNSGIIGVGDRGVNGANATNSIRIGTGATLLEANKQINSIAIGVDTKATATHATALGAEAEASLKNSIALGNKSTTKVNASAVTSATIGSITYSGFAGATNIAAGDQVSVGAAGAERQIKHVAPGAITAASTDAINGSQLYSIVNGLGFGVNADNNSLQTHQLGKELAIVAGNTTEATSSANLKTNVAQDNATGKTTVTISMKEAPTFTSVTTQDAAGNKTITNGSGVTITPAGGGKSVSLTTGGLNNGGNKITNVANGTADTDAVNFSQLQAMGSAAKTHYYSVNSTETGADSNYNNDGATGVDALAAGVKAKAEQRNSVAIGNQAQVVDSPANPSSGSIAIGDKAKAQGDLAVALGAGATVSGESAAGGIAIGAAASSNNGGMAVGSGANAGNGTAMIPGLPVRLNNNVALGDSAKVKDDTNFNVALGSFSIAGETDLTATPYKPTANAVVAGVAEAGVQLGEVSVGGDNTAGMGQKLYRRVTNVAAGAADTDAVNVSQLKAAQAAATSKVEAGDGITVTSKVDNTTGSTTYTVAADTTALTVGDGNNGNPVGKVIEPTGADANKLATAGDIAKAINNSGFTLTAQGEATTASQVNPGETVDLRNTDGNIVVQKTAADNTISFDLASTVKIGPAAGGKPITINGTVGTISGLTGNLPATSSSTPYTTDQEAPANAAAISGNAATVGDVLNAGWNLQGNGTAVDFVKPYDTVNFADGTGTTVTTQTTGSVTTVKVNVNAQNIAETAQLPVVYTQADGSKVYKHTDGNFYDAPNGAGNQVAAGDVIASMQSAGGSTTAPTKLANVAAGTANTDAVNVSQLKGAADALGGGAGIADGSDPAVPAGTFIQPSYSITKTDGTTYPVANNVGTALSNLNAEVVKPITFAGDSGADSARKLGEKLTIKGGVTDANKLTDNNIGIVSDGNGTLTAKLAQNIDLGDNGSVKTGDTKMDNSGITIAAPTPTNPANTVSLTKDGLNNGGNKITNVANGAADTDAVNVSQLKAAQAAATSKVEAGDGITVTSKVDNTTGSTTYTVAADTTALTVGDGNNGNPVGKVIEPTGADANKLATAGDIAKAINNSGFQATAGGNLASGSTATPTTVKPGQKVTFAAGDGLTVKQDVNGTTGDQTYTYALNAQAVVQNAQTPVVYTKADGSKVYKHTDGNFYDKPEGQAGAQQVQPGDVIARMQDAGGDTTKPTTLGNVKSNLADASTVTTNPTGNDRATLTANGKGNNAATVNDVLNAGFTVQGNGTDKDFVTHGDTINFVNGQGTVAKVNTTGGVTEVKFDTPLTYVDPAGQASNAPSNKVNLVGVAAGDAVTLGNVADGNIAANSKDAVNGGQLHTTNQNVANNATNIAKGINFGGTTGSNNYQLGQTINVTGDDNITSTTVTGGAKLALNPNLSVTSVTTKDAAGNQTVTNGSGVTITPAAAGSSPVSLTTGGLDNGGNKITNVGAGTNPNDAVNVGQLNQALGAISGSNNANIVALDAKVNDVANTANAGVAQAIATAGLPQAYLPGKNMVAVGGGYYKGETGYAIGFSTISDNGNWIIKATGSGNSRGNFGGSIGAGYQW